MAVFDDGSGEALFVGAWVPAGPYQSIVARWSNGTWTTLWYGAARAVSDIEVFDSGGGPQLYVTWFTTYYGGSGFSSTAVDRWTGSSWTSVYSQSSFLKTPYTPQFKALAPSWTTPAKLFIGGKFGYQQPGSNLVPGPLASYNGTTVVQEGGPNLVPGPDILTLHSVSGAPGPGLFVGGSFTQIGGVPAANVALWDGVAWSALGSGVNGPVNAIAAFDDGRGPGVFVGGLFGTAGGQPMGCIARWDGMAWTGLDAGFPSQVEALAVFDDDGPGPGSPWLYVGGTGFIRAWGCPRCYADCDSDGSLTPADFGCFQAEYVLAHAYADCNASGSLTIADFGCFQTRYVLGCP